MGSFDRRSKRTADDLRAAHLRVASHARECRSRRGISLPPPGVMGYGVSRFGNRGASGSGDAHSVRSRDQSDRRIHLDDISFTTAVALLNPSDQQVTVTVTAFGDDGDQVGTTQLALAPHTKSANVLAAYAGMAGVFRKQGRVIVSAPNGAVSVLALRFGGAGFSNIPVNHR